MKMGGAKKVGARLTETVKICMFNIHLNLTVTLMVCNIMVDYGRPQIYVALRNNAFVKMYL